jgi:hypothetical protein
MTGEAWTTKVITALWDYALAIWKEQNEAYHGVEEHESRLKRSDNLLAGPIPPSSRLYTPLQKISRRYSEDI